MLVESGPLLANASFIAIPDQPGGSAGMDASSGAVAACNTPSETPTKRLQHKARPLRMHNCLRGAACFGFIFQTNRMRAGGRHLQAAEADLQLGQACQAAGLLLCAAALAVSRAQRGSCPGTQAAERQ